MLGWPNINPCPMLSTTKDRTNQDSDQWQFVFLKTRFLPDLSNRKSKTRVYLNLNQDLYKEEVLVRT